MLAVWSERVSHESRKVGDEVRSRKLRSEKSGRSRLSGCGQKQIDGFGDGEEVAARGGIGDGERKTGGDLAGEDFGDAAAGGEDVAEAENGSTRGEDDLFGDALGRAHHGGGRDGLVGGKQDDAGAVREGRCDERFGGEDVVGDGGQGLLFDEGNVLEGSGVEDEARAVKREDLVEESAVRDVAEVEGCAVGDGSGLRSPAEDRRGCFPKIRAEWCARRRMRDGAPARNRWSRRAGDENRAADER